MKRTITVRGLGSFGKWLYSEIRAKGMNQSEFAERAGVSTTTVSRWVNGRIPEAKFIDPIADVLVLDYDLVATRAGYRPRALLQMDPDSPEAVLLPLIRQVRWTEDELMRVENDLRFLIGRQRQAPLRAVAESNDPYYTQGPPEDDEAFVDHTRRALNESVNH